MLNVCDAPDARDAALHGKALEQALVLLNASPSGKLLVTCRFVAASGPLFVTVTE